jgi:hypothetical protein
MLVPSTKTTVSTVMKNTVILRRLAGETSWSSHRDAGKSGMAGWVVPASRDLRDD